MTKKQTKQNEVQKCFELSPLFENSNVYYKSKIIINLCINKKKTKKRYFQTKCYPVFNHDGLYFTPTFILERDKQIVSFLTGIFKNQYQGVLNKNQEKSLNFVNENSQLYLFDTFQKVCSICKVEFDSYYEHIQNLVHVKNLKKSQYNQHIYDLCSSFNDQTIKFEQQSQKISSDMQNSYTFKPIVQNIQSIIYDSVPINQLREGFFDKSKPFSLQFCNGCD